jgi:hypothetical protein
MDQAHASSLRPPARPVTGFIEDGGSCITWRPLSIGQSRDAIRRALPLGEDFERIASLTSIVQVRSSGQPLTARSVSAAKRS